MNRILRGPAIGSVAPFLGSGPELLGDTVKHLIEEAADEAFERGLREGRQRGIAEVQLAADHLRMGLAASVDEISAMHAEAASGALDIGMEIARFVTGSTPHDGGEALRERIGEVLAEMRERPIVVSVSGHDVDGVAEALVSTAGAEVVVDASLGEGEARIAGPWGAADITREVAFEAARRALS